MELQLFGTTIAFESTDDTPQKIIDRINAARKWMRPACVHDGCVMIPMPFPVTVLLAPDLVVGSPYPREIVRGRIERGDQCHAT